MASHYDLYAENFDANYSDYNYDANYSDYNYDLYTGPEPSLEAKIDECVDSFETGQEVSCGINHLKLEQAMNYTQTGLLNCFRLKPLKLKLT